MLALDNFGARGIADGCAGGGASVDGVMDVYGALMQLASLPSIDPERIAMVGYSFGANVALSAVEFDGPERLFDRQFAAAVAYYPVVPREARGLGADRDPDRRARRLGAARACRG